MHMKPATAKISSVALKHNIQTIKQKAPNSKIIAVVKANAYGHGVVFVSSAVESGIKIAFQRYYQADFVIRRLFLF